MTDCSRDEISSELYNFVRASLKRGRGEGRVHAAPAVSCAHAFERIMHTSIQVWRRQSGLPCAMVFDLYALSLEIGFLAPIASGFLPANLMPAPRHQDHATSSSAKACYVDAFAPKTFASTAACPNVRDVRETPLMRDRMAGLYR